MSFQEPGPPHLQEPYGDTSGCISTDLSLASLHALASPSPLLELGTHRLLWDIGLHFFKLHCPRLLSIRFLSENSKKLARI